jgi:hypothetical protein
MAAALATVAAKTVVGQLIQGTPMTRDSWSETSKQIIDALTRQEAGFDRLSRQIGEIPVREFDEHMAAGRRHLRDLPGEWRDERDRDDLIHDARIEFVHAESKAQRLADAQRQALAEVAIGGCWVWAGSLARAQNAFRTAREALEQRILAGAEQADRGVMADYTEVLKLCKRYGERPAMTAVPEPYMGSWVDIAVRAVPDQWVECAGIELKTGLAQPSTPARRGRNPPYIHVIHVEVRNGRQEAILVRWAPAGPERRGGGGWTTRVDRELVEAGAAASRRLTWTGETVPMAVWAILPDRSVPARVRENRRRIAFLVPTMRQALAAAWQARDQGGH